MTRRVRQLVVGVLALVLVAAQDGTAPLFTFRDVRIVESSGIAASERRDDLFWTHNDKGGEPVLYAVDDRGETVATVHVDGVENVDWEDIARAPGPDGQPSLWIADTGDADADRDDAAIIVVPEPLVRDDETGLSLRVAATRYAIAYDDGPVNAEALLVDRTGRVAVISKGERGTDPVVYSAPQLVRDDVTELVAVATIDLEDPPPPPGPEATPPPGRFAVTGADVAPDGSLLVIRTYGDAVFLPVPPGRPFTEAFTSRVTRVLLPASRMGEGIAFTRRGSALVTSSEGEQAPVHAVAIPEGVPLPTFVPDAPPRTIDVTPTRRPVTGLDGERRLRVVMMLGLGGLVVVGLGARVARSRRAAARRP